LINIQELYPVGAAVGIEADQDTVDSLMKKLSNSPNVLRVMRASGNHNLITSLVAEDFGKLESFINNHIRSEAGIKHVEVNITSSSGIAPDFAFLRLVDEKEIMLDKIKKKKGKE
jgi:DNA-binding Lrp family transcriptional regulator